MTRLAPGRPLTTIECIFAVVGISDGEIFHSDFPSLLSRSHHMLFLNHHSLTILNRPLGNTELLIMFDVTTAVVRQTFRKRSESPQPFDQHQALEPDVKSGMVMLPLEAFTHRRTMAPKDLAQTVREISNPNLTNGWIHSFIGRRLD
jgi:hypothetical protein